MFVYVCEVHTVALTPVACFASLTCSPAIHLTLSLPDPLPHDSLSKLGLP